MLLARSPTVPIPARRRQFRTAPHSSRVSIGSAVRSTVEGYRDTARHGGALRSRSSFPNPVDIDRRGAPSWSPLTWSGDGKADHDHAPWRRGFGQVGTVARHANRNLSSPLRHYAAIFFEFVGSLVVCSGRLIQAGAGGFGCCGRRLPKRSGLAAWAASRTRARSARMAW